MKLPIIILAIATLFPLPLQAAKTLDIPIESVPCKTVLLPSGGRACVPPKVSQVIVPNCFWVTIREGKKDRVILVCAKPRSLKVLPQETRTPRPAGGY